MPLSTGRLRGVVPVLKTAGILGSIGKPGATAAPLGLPGTIPVLKPLAEPLAPKPMVPNDPMMGAMKGLSRGQGGVSPVLRGGGVSDLQRRGGRGI
jgi:hypothetical protein